MSIIFETTEREKLLIKKHKVWMINGFIDNLQKQKDKLWNEVLELEKKLNEGTESDSTSSDLTGTP